MKRLTQKKKKKFRLSKANLDFFDRENWSIKNAQNGDIVEFIHPDIQIWNKGGKQFFIYKSLNKGKDKIYPNSSETTIIFHAVLVIPYNKLVVSEDMGVGDVNHPEWYKLATDEEYEMFYEKLYEKGYKWDKNKLEIVKI